MSLMERIPGVLPVQRTDVTVEVRLSVLASSLARATGARAGSAGRGEVEIHLVASDAGLGTGARVVATGPDGLELRRWEGCDLETFWQPDTGMRHVTLRAGGEAILECVARHGRILWVRSVLPDELGLPGGRYEVAGGGIAVGGDRSI